MSRYLPILVLLLCLTGAAVAQSINRTTSSPVYRIAKCAPDGVAPDGGAIQGLLVPAGTKLMKTWADTVWLCLFDGGTPPDGCHDGGACYGCSPTAGRTFPAGYREVFRVPTGGVGFNCASYGDAGVEFEAVTTSAPGWP